MQAKKLEKILKKKKNLVERIEKLDKDLEDHNYAEYLQLKGELEGLNLKKDEQHFTKIESCMDRCEENKYIYL